jgi:hypothetical protein
VPLRLRAFPKSLGKPRICHPERSEGSLLRDNEILHFVQTCYQKSNRE